MKNRALSFVKWNDTQLSPIVIFIALLVPSLLLLGVGLGRISPTYSGALSSALFLGIVILLRLDELMMTIIVAVHILVDAYLQLDLYQVALLMSLLLLFVCYLRKSSGRSWTGPRLIWLWVLFLILTIYPTIEGGAFSLTNSIAFYLNLVFSAFIIFWLGNIVAKDIVAVRRVFQCLTFLATLIAVHTLLEVTTGKFVLETAQTQNSLIQFSNFMISGTNVSRAGSFFINPNANGDFLAFNFFLSLGLCMQSEHMLPKLLFLMETIVIVLALMLTYSSASWVALMAGVLAFTCLAGQLQKSVLVLMLVVMLAVIIYTVFPSQVAAQLHHSNNQSEISLHMGDWQTTIKVIEAYPWSGVGLGNQAYLIRAEPFRVPAQTIPLAEPDNAFLQWGATAGIPVLLVFLLLLGSVFWLAVRNWSAIDTRYRALFGGGIAALVALSVNSLFVDGWTDPAGMCLLGWLIAGILTSPLIGANQSRDQQSSVTIDHKREEIHSRENAAPPVEYLKRDSLL
jgi:O-antigen ligase